MKKQLLIFVLVCTAVTGGFAQGSYDIKEVTPAVQAAKDGRKARYAELKELKTKGLVGETNRGYVQKLGGGKQVDAVVAAENKDRKTVYEAIVAQNHLAPEALAEIERIAAGLQRRSAEPGEKVQDASGRWN